MLLVACTFRASCFNTLSTHVRLKVFAFEVNTWKTINRLLWALQRRLIQTVSETVTTSSGEHRNKNSIGYLPLSQQTNWPELMNFTKKWKAVLEHCSAYDAPSSIPRQNFLSSSSEVNSEATVGTRATSTVTPAVRGPYAGAPSRKETFSLSFYVRLTRLSHKWLHDSCTKAKNYGIHTSSGNSILPF